MFLKCGILKAFLIALHCPMITQLCLQITRQIQTGMIYNIYTIVVE